MKSALRVIHIIGGGEFGGAEDHIIHLLKQMHKEGIETQVVCFYDSLFANILREQGVTVHVLQYGRFDIRLFFGLVNLLKKIKPNIVHTHGVKANFFGRLAAKRVGVTPVVTTVHSLLKYDYLHPVTYRLAQMLENSTRMKTDYYIAISERIQQQLLEEKIPADKIQIIHHGIDTEKFSPKQDAAADALAKEWGKTEGTHLVGAVGRLQSVKGFTYFIQACAILHQKKPGTFRFVLVGDGPQRPELEALIKKEGLQDVFHLTGFRNDVDTCLRALDYYVSSSLSEGLGLAVMEALSVGVPVTATGVGGIKDFAKDESNCLIIEPKSKEQIVEAIERFYHNQDFAKALTSQAMHDIRTSFSLEQMGKTTAKYYKKWLGSE